MRAYKSAADCGELSLRKPLSYLRKSSFAGYNAAMIAITKKYIAMRMPEVAASSKRNALKFMKLSRSKEPPCRGRNLVFDQATRLGRRSGGTCHSVALR